MTCILNFLHTELITYLIISMHTYILNHTHIYSPNLDVIKIKKRKETIRKEKNNNMKQNKTEYIHTYLHSYKNIQKQI